MQIGLREVYDAVQALRADVNTWGKKTDMLGYRVEQLEKARDTRRTAWPVWVGVGGAYLATLVPLVVR